MFNFAERILATRNLGEKCLPWQKGDDCGFDQRTGRIVILCILLVLSLVTGYLTVVVHKKNKYWMSRPVLCLLLCLVSLVLDITEHSIILGTMDPEHPEKFTSSWYSTNTLDSTGDIFLAASLVYFASIWCDNIALIRTQSNPDISPSARYKGLKTILGVFAFVVFGTVPMVLAFVVSSYNPEIYDTVAKAYTGWGAFTGFFLLTPISLYMIIIVKQINLPENAAEGEKKTLEQLKYQAKVNWYQQVLWNFFIILAMITFNLYLDNDNNSAPLIGTATVSIQITFLLLHAQVIGFFFFVPSSREPSPVFDEHLLRKLLDSEEVEFNKRQHTRKGKLKVSRKSSDTDVLDSADVQPIDASESMTTSPTLV